MNAHPTLPLERPPTARLVPPEAPLSPLRFFRTVLRNPFETWPRAVYRDPVYRSSFLGRPTLYVMDPALVRAVLVDQAESFEKSEVLRRSLSPALGDAILTADGARWRWQRRAAAPIFRNERIVSFLPAMIAAAERTRDALAAGPPEAETDLAQMMMRTTFDIIVATMLSGDGQIDVARVEQGITDYLESTSWIFAMTLLRAPAWMPYPGRTRSERARGYLRDELLRLVADMRRTGVEGRNDLMSLLVAARDPETGRAMDDRDVADNLLTFVTAGHETTALALAWTLYLLALHPGIEARVVAEIEAVTGGGSVEPGHVEALAFTRQTILEAMRLYPPAPVIVRAALADVEIGGHRVPRGTPVTVPIYAIHRHARLWDDPDRFDPDRFAPEAAKARDRYAYLPFGAGPRICIGMSFAMLEAVAVLAVLIRSLHFRLAPGFVPTLKQRITLRPAEGMPMRVARRDG
ncbi:cytochrome P450 [Methylobacterium nodulans]|uniref:Cytochrome P450 n=1 Tax=Methylobacterium nodulans (strain LMG 21967 / CNCM I-2342 / ORS 2060) TaxID=460265 RepID=B8IG35_METNO|nr:cytochrome P450 [Methylobacterium nodulans]ACL61512.1 cytochrome P450 [Methylobacterium nodulans ORS 2060]